MGKVRTGWGYETPSDLDEKWKETRLRRVRDFIKEHMHSARRFVDGESKRLTQKQYWKSPVIIYTGDNGKREYIIPDAVFRDNVCGRMPWPRVLHTLQDNGFLNGDDRLIARDLVERIGRVAVASIKPKILKYRTEAEKRADQQQAEGNVRRVRDYIKQHEKMALLLAMRYAQRLTKQQLLEAPLLAHVRRRKLVEFIFSRRQFRREFSSEERSAKTVLEHLLAAGLLNVTDDDDRGGWLRRDSVSPSISGASAG